MDAVAQARRAAWRTCCPLTDLGAPAINLFCAVLLASHRHHAGSLTKAALLSAREVVVAARSEKKTASAQR
ncbi:hypothetical protein [Caulobacter sp. RHG1]|uniref:hypothetical protein n=1 Tax=Caulobacter sp. (strain RHG1) TaxID=2545762 RepID=UPI0019D5F7CE|nr:hypothetical protein [Caulobacter sp. RHG1]NQE64312.1 hypothetical protein [Caulobacter sp. RHG1]